MTAPAAKRAPRPRKPPAEATPPEPPETALAHYGFDSVLASHPEWQGLFTSIPAALLPAVISNETDAAMREAANIARRLPEAHRLMLDAWEAQAREAVFGPLKEWLGAIGAPPWEAPLEPLPVRRRPSRARRALVEDGEESTDTTEGAAGLTPAPSVEQDEPDGAA